MINEITSVLRERTAGFWTISFAGRFIAIHFESDHRTLEAVLSEIDKLHKLTGVASYDDPMNGSVTSLILEGPT